MQTLSADLKLARADLRASHEEFNALLEDRNRVGTYARISVSEWVGAYARISSVSGWVRGLVDGYSCM